MSASFLISSLEYKYPVGFPGLQISIAFVLGVINFSNSSIAGNAKLSSILEITGTTFSDFSLVTKRLDQWISLTFRCLKVQPSFAMPSSMRMVLLT